MTAPFLFADQVGCALSWRLWPSASCGTLLERRFGALTSSLLSGAAGMALVSIIETPPLFTETEAFPVYGANSTALRLLCACGSSTTAVAARRGG